MVVCIKQLFSYLAMTSIIEELHPPKVCLKSLFILISMKII